MGQIVSEGHRQALDMMSDARQMLFRELHEPACRTCELVAGGDRLALASKFVEPLRASHSLAAIWMFLL